MEQAQSDIFQPPQVNFIREGLIIGLINGGVALLLLFGSYSMGLNTFVDVQFITGFIPYMFLVVLLNGFRLRKKNGGYLALKEALQYGFMSYVVAAIMVAIGTYILYNLVDPTLTQTAFDIQKEKTVRTMRSLNLSTKELDEELAKISKKKPETTGFKTIFLGLGIDLIWHFLKSFLIAFIIRREKPIV